jgi:hypothetical protein
LEDWFEPALNIQTPLSPSPSSTPFFFYFSLENSVAKRNYFRVEKLLEGNFGFAYQVSPILTTLFYFFLISQ